TRCEDPELAMLFAVLHNRGRKQPANRSLIIAAQAKHAAEGRRAFYVDVLRAEYAGELHRRRESEGEQLFCMV
ncbi:MAG TPA: hypothetical protein VK993_09580, partial [Chthoniobacterales bacterium]|nr:hypothetical protein [Chthoniobacterales bacterium]